MSPLLVMGLCLVLVWLVIALPRVAGTLLFCFFVTACVKCEVGGDSATAALLLGEGTVITWLLFALGNARSRERLRTRAGTASTPPAP